ncbi:nitronate monooxygenase, partial [bacterium]|nr:nitronate monooxygenase [bacterium]
MSHPLSERLFRKGGEFLGVRYPFIAGAMTWVSEPGLVSAVCNAGGFACLAGGNSPAELLEKQILDTRRLTDKPFGVNLTFLPSVKPPDYPGYVKAIIDGGVKIVETAGN